MIKFGGKPSFRQHIDYGSFPIYDKSAITSGARHQPLRGAFLLLQALLVVADLQTWAGEGFWSEQQVGGGKRCSSIQSVLDCRLLDQYV